MKRFGSDKGQMAPAADPNVLFRQRLYLLVIMVKARLKGYPVGNHRQSAVLENAAHLHQACNRIDITLPNAKAGVHLFKERVKLLCIMATALISDEYPLGVYRRDAILENIDSIAVAAFPEQELLLFHDILMAA
jgi:hypothetical protein